MKNKKQNTLVIVMLIFIVLAIIYAVYTYLLSPKWDEIRTLETQSTQLFEKEIELKEQLQLEKDNSEENAVNESLLYMKVPENRDISQVVRLIEQFEGTSNTQVSEVTFNNYDTTAVDQYNEQQQEAEEVGAAQEAEVSGEEQEQEKKPESLLLTSNLPENMKLLTVSMTVSAQEEKEVVAFLKEVEASLRIMRVDSIDYTGIYPEDTEVTDETTKEQQMGTTGVSEYPVQAIVQLTTFYVDGGIESEQ